MNHVIDLKLPILNTYWQAEQLPEYSSPFFFILTLLLAALHEIQSNHMDVLIPHSH